MTIRNLAEVGAHLEEAYNSLPGEPSTKAEQYETYEMLAIQILDSEYMNYSEGVLEEYLLQFLKLKQDTLDERPKRR